MTRRPSPLEAARQLSIASHACGPGEGPLIAPGATDQGGSTAAGRRRPPAGSASRARSLEAISGRNKLLGRISSIRLGDLLAQVTIAIGDQSLTAIITRDACRALGLRVGTAAYGLIKATEVMVIRA
jgi:molybdopterin-binding protein